MRIATLLCLLAVTLPAASAQKNPTAPKLETTKQRVSYAIGLNIGRQLQQQDLDTELVTQAIATILNGQEPALTEDEMRAAFEAFQTEQAEVRQQQASRNIQAGKEFLAANARKEGVKITKSGLQYKVLKEGSGESPTAEDTFVAHYKGMFIDGNVFDSSYEGAAPTADDEPLTLGVTDVIPGWTEGLQLMNVGGKYRFFIPSSIAYGPEGRPGIPPNSTLVFDVELLAVQ